MAKVLTHISLSIVSVAAITDLLLGRCNLDIPLGMGVCNLAGSVLLNP
jgi:hypothetical protein